MRKGTDEKENPVSEWKPVALQATKDSGPCGDNNPCGGGFGVSDEPEVGSRPG